MESPAHTSQFRWSVYVLRQSNKQWNSCKAEGLSFAQGARQQTPHNLLELRERYKTFSNVIMNKDEWHIFITPSFT